MNYFSVCSLINLHGIPMLSSWLCTVIQKCDNIIVVPVCDCDVIMVESLWKFSHNFFASFRCTLMLLGIWAVLPCCVVIICVRQSCHESFISFKVRKPLFMAINLPESKNSVQLLTGLLFRSSFHSVGVCKITFQLSQHDYKQSIHHTVFCH